MTWWSNADFAGDLNEVLSHVNEATDAPSSSATHICELYFHALNKWWNAFARHQGELGRADTPSFIGLLRSLCDSSRLTLLNCKPINDLVDLCPEVLDHSVLKLRGYRPGKILRILCGEMQRRSIGSCVTRITLSSNRTLMRLLTAF